MNCTHSFSAAEMYRPGQPVASNTSSDSVQAVNSLGIRILNLKSIPVESCARLTAFLSCASDLQGMPQRFVPLLAGELRTACATLPTLQQRYASNALDSVTVHGS